MSWKQSGVQCPSILLICGDTDSMWPLKNLQEFIGQSRSNTREREGLKSPFLFGFQLPIVPLEISLLFYRLTYWCLTSRSMTGIVWVFLQSMTGRPYRFLPVWKISDLDLELTNQNAISLFSWYTVGFQFPEHSPVFLTQALPVADHEKVIHRNSTPYPQESHTLWITCSQPVDNLLTSYPHESHNLPTGIPQPVDNLFIACG